MLKPDEMNISVKCKKDVNLTGPDLARGLCLFFQLFTEIRQEIDKNSVINIDEFFNKIEKIIDPSLMTKIKQGVIAIYEQRFLVKA